MLTLTLSMMSFVSVVLHDDRLTLLVSPLLPLLLWRLLQTMMAMMVLTMMMRKKMLALSVMMR